MNKTTFKEKTTLPDIAQDSLVDSEKAIQRVGMENIKCPVFFIDKDQKWETEGSCDVFVDLKKNTRGIHMSRLYETLLDHSSKMAISPAGLDALLDKLLQSHCSESSAAETNIAFSYKCKQNSLVSNKQAYRYYPIQLNAKKANDISTYKLQFTIIYSSTCPCSAALSRHAIQENFINQHDSQTHFSKEDIVEWLGNESSIAATPHAQRSKATLTLEFGNAFSYTLSELINGAESSIQTAVQSLVKRIDEQEFAKRNAQNLLFCEDAVRRFASWLDTLPNLTRYHVKATHYESLHAHNATAEIYSTANSTKQK